MITVTVYYRDDSAASAEAFLMLDELQAVVPHRLVKIQVDGNTDLYPFPDEELPVVETGPYKLRTPFTKQDLQVVLASARDRAESLDAYGGKQYQKRLERARRLSNTDRFTYWVSRRYMILFNLATFLYLAFAFVAPVLMQMGAELPAKAIYTVYKPLCHQLSFRSWFLFGDQFYYPRELANISDVITYEELAALFPDRLIEVGEGAEADVVYEAYSTDRFPERLIPPEAPNWEFSARRFVGTEHDHFKSGYKVALCQRCTAIWGAIFLFGVFFAVTGRRIKALPWYWWVVFGLVPIGLDGTSQLAGFVDGLLPAWMIVRESTPLLRVATGTLFGVTSSWMIYPLIEETMKETRQMMARKIAVVQQIQT